MTSINTNIGAMVAQKNMLDNSRDLDQAMARISSGLRINSAADDAAGSAIASKMESQVKSLGVAIRNSNDAISMTQTAEGALNEMESILQRVRELAVQAGNSTLSTSDRVMIQDEVNALTSEIDSIAAKTNFNGVKLLDGSKDVVNFQIGIDASDSLAVNLQKSDAAALGLKGSPGVGVYSSERIMGTDFSANNAQIDVSDIKINGQNALSQAFSTTMAASTVNEAKSVADAINLNTSVHGAVANAYNQVTSSAVGDFKMTTTFTLDGNGTAHTVEIATSYQGLVDNINETVPSMNAVLNSDNTITLSNQTGSQINIGNTQGATDVGFVQNTTYTGFISLTNNDGSAVKIEAGSESNGYENGVGTIADVNAFGFNEVSDGKSVETDTVSGTALVAGELKLNGILIGKSSSGSAQHIASAINALTSEHGVTADAQTAVDVILDISVLPATHASEFSINKAQVNLTGSTTFAQIVTNINDAAIGDVRASLTSDGHLRLESDSGASISVASSGDVDLVKGYRDINGTITQTGVKTGTATADPNSLAVTLDMTALTAGVLDGVDNASTNLNSKVTFLTSGNDSAKTVSIVGTDIFGNAQTEVLTLGNATTVTSANYFNSVTSFTLSAVSAANVTMGTISSNGDAADIDSLITAADLSAVGANTSYTLNGALATSTTLASAITLANAGADTAVDATITGTDMSGNVISETVSLTSAGSVTTTNVFNSVTDIKTSAALQSGNFTVGTAVQTGDAFTVQGKMTLSNASGSPIQIDTVLEDTAALLASGAATDVVLQKVGLQGQSTSAVVTGENVSVSTLDQATSSLAKIDAAIEKVSSFRSSFGAVENRIDASINNLTTLKINTEAAKSRIEDADFARETSNMTKAQILSQAATSMLAQANSSKQNLLALLQG
tara:strand:- start:1 stop:2718 length:2718 start_codon:yes stop_codon:yes gene_type:complete